jgi:hypothetical protein
MELAQLWEGTREHSWAGPCWQLETGLPLEDKAEPKSLTEA